MWEKRTRDLDVTFVNTRFDHHELEVVFLKPQTADCTFPTGICKRRLTSGWWSYFGTDISSSSCIRNRSSSARPTRRCMPISSTWRIKAGRSICYSVWSKNRFNWSSRHGILPRRFVAFSKIQRIHLLRAHAIDQRSENKFIRRDGTRRKRVKIGYLSSPHPFTSFANRYSLAHLPTGARS